MPKSSSYSMKNVAATIDGKSVHGLWDGDDAIVVEQLEDVGSIMVGADGSSIFSQSANLGATITLRLQHSSPTHKLLHQRWARQRATGNKVTGFPVTVADVDSAEGGATDQAFIQAAPSDSKGKTATVREWVLVTGDWKPSIPA
jgi:hypothetical protein